MWRDPGSASLDPARADPRALEARPDRALPGGARWARRAPPGVRAHAPMPGADPATSPHIHHRPWRLPAREPADRRAGGHGGARLGARTPRRSARGPGLAVRSGLAGW